MSADRGSAPHLNLATRLVKTTCCYCGVGCGVLAETDGEQILSVQGDPDHPANHGRLCSKGSTLHLSASPLIQAQTRALYPEMRQRTAHHDSAPATAPARSRVSWDEALGYTAERFAAIINEHGPDSVAFYISGQLLTEDYYVFNKLAKGLIGTNNIDTNSRLCMSSAVAGYKQTLGADAPPACYDDIDLADLIFIVGANPAYAHPVLYRRIEAARAARPHLKVIVADPRRTDTAREADLFLPILPGTDVALFNGMLHICLWEDLIDADYIANHTDGFAELKQLVREYHPQYVAKTCGIREEDLLLAARLFGKAGSALSLYCQGLNQSSHGTMKNAALINLHLATHQIGKPGAGPFSLTGQPNAMGGREVGGMANLLSGHRDLANPAHRAEVAALWDVPDVPATPGKTAIDMFEAVRKGEIKAIWIACTNPAQSLPDQKMVRMALENAELVVVQESFHTSATVQYADVLLPASTWGEKHGTVTNSERRISRCLPLLPKPGESQHDWEIVIAFAQRLEALLGSKKRDGGTLFPYQDPEQIWNEHRASTLGRDLDIGGLSYALLEQQGPQQWPFPAGATQGRARLYEDGRFPTPNQRARFIATAYLPLADAVDARFPFSLNTGRLRDQWHGMSRTGSVPQLFAHAPEPAVLLARSDMERRLLQEGDLVHLTSRRGSQILPARASDDLRAGQAFVAMHWGEEYVSGRSGASLGEASFGVNSLTSPAVCPSSKQPELKHAAIKILKAELPWRMVLFGWLAPDSALRVQAVLRPFMRQFAYASATLFGREQCGVLFRAADDSPAAPELLNQLQALFYLQQREVLRYDDARRGTSRRILVQSSKISAALLAGDVSAEIWLKSYLDEGLSVEGLGRLLLMPSSKPPSGFQPTGRVVCACHNVREGQIIAALQGRQGLARDLLIQLQEDLKCGTGCGSCVPELKQLIDVNALGRKEAA